MNRRGFLGAILATMAAPAIVRASSLMPVVVRPAAVDAADVFTWDMIVKAKETMKACGIRPIRFIETYALLPANPASDELFEYRVLTAADFPDMSQILIADLNGPRWRKRHGLG